MEIRWQWAACGKHPLAKDFFRLGQYGALAGSFSDWVDGGYRLAAGREKGPAHSWRFWAGRGKKNAVACGVIRDSADQMARPYPFLIMGVGDLPGWENEWDLMPAALEKTWSQMEYLYTSSPRLLKELEKEVRRMPSPLCRWPELREKAQDAGKNPTRMDPPGDSQEPAHSRWHANQEGSENLILLNRYSGDPLAAIHKIHYALKAKDKVPPHAVFMGGTAEAAYVAVFRRPLAPADFARLWSLSGVEGT